MDKELHERINAMRAESKDPAFTAYLNELEAKIKDNESKLSVFTASLDESYEKYKAHMAAASASAAAPAPGPAPAPQSAPAPAPATAPQPGPAVVTPRSMQPQGAPAPMPAPGVPPMPRPGAAPVVPGQAPVPGRAPVPPRNVVPQPAPAPVNNGAAYSMAYNVPRVKESQDAVEFKFGTVILSVIGVIFVLAALIIFGVNYMNNTILQGCFFYGLGIALIVVSELVFAKRIEKFSVVLTSLGIGGIYITTVLAYVYLKIFPVWAAALITLVITAFFFYFSKKKNSEIIRLISIIGCYMSLMPLKEIEYASDYLLPALMVIAVSLGGVFFPVKEKRNLIADYIQTFCMFAVIIRLDAILATSRFTMGELTSSGYSSWLTFIFLGVELTVAHLLYMVSLKNTDDKANFPQSVLYFITFSVTAIISMLLIGDEKWQYFGILGAAILTPALIYMLKDSIFKYVPYFYLTGFVLLVFLFDQDTFWFSISTLVFYATNKVIAYVEKKYNIYDMIFSTWSALVVCTFMRDKDVRFIGYIFAVCILVSALLETKYKRYMIYMAVSFAWVFLFTEDCEPFLSSIFVTVLALGMIFGGFIKKEKAIRIYGLVLIIVVALKLVIFDFAHSDTSFRILVFLIVGILIIGVSLLYIVFEKKEIEARAPMQAMGQGAPAQPYMQPQMPPQGMPVQQPQMDQNTQMPGQEMQ